MSPRSIRCASSVARAASLPSWLETSRGAGRIPQLVEQRAGAAGVLAGDEVGADQRLAHPRRDVVEVADRRRADDERAGHQPAPLFEFGRAPSPRRRSSRRRCRASPRGSASRSSAFSARSRTSRRAGSSSRSPAAITPPPTTIALGWKMLAKLEQATPSRLPISSKTPIATSSPASAHSVTTLPSTSPPSASTLPSAESGRAFRRRPALAAERRARGQRLDAAVVGAVALAGRAVGLDHDVAELGPGPGRAAVDLAVEDQPAADPGPDRQHHRCAASPGRRRRGTRRARRRCRRCRRRPAGRPAR